MNIGDVMDEIAERLRQAPSLTGRTFPYPPGTISAPSAIVSYPETVNFDETYGRGLDRMNGGMVHVVVGQRTARTTRDQLTKYLDGSGPESVKALLDADGYTSCDYVRVTDVEIVVYTVGGIDYIAALFNLDIAGQGA